MKVSKILKRLETIAQSKELIICVQINGITGKTEVYQNDGGKAYNISLAKYAKFCASISSADSTIDAIHRAGDVLRIVEDYERGKK